MLNSQKKSILKKITNYDKGGIFMTNPLPKKKRKISQMQIENNENNSVNSSVISGKKRMNSIRLSDLLTGKISMKPSKETGGRYIKRGNKCHFQCNC